MNIGLIKEMKPFEHRIMLSPQAVSDLLEDGHRVYVENDAGVESGYQDKDYEGAGAEVMPTPEKVFDKVEMLLKVQPPMPIEFELIRQDHIIISLLLPVVNVERLHALQKSHAIFFAAELLSPVGAAMDEISGRVAINQSVKYLERDYGSKGILFSGVAGIPGATICILGDSPMGLAAARQAYEYGAKVNLVGMNYKKLTAFKEAYPSDNMNIFEYDRGLLNTLFLETDVLLVPAQADSGEAPIKIRKREIKILTPGSLVIDLSINHGDCIEGSRQTLQDDPIYASDRIIYYAVPDLAAAVPRTSSEALSNTCIPYVRQLAGMGFEESITTSPEIRHSLYLYKGKIVNPQIAQIDGFQDYDVLELIESNI
jgi:alanine dehydrogenase